MLRPPIALLTLLLALLLSGCTPDVALMTKADERALAAQMFEAIDRARASQDDFPVPAGSSLQLGGYRGLANNLQRGKPRLVGAYRVVGPEGARAILTYSVEGEGRSSLVSIAIRRKEGRPFADHVNITQLPRPLSELQGVRLGEASAGTIALLVLPLLSIAVAGAAVYRIWQSGQFRRRILWTIGCLFGIAQLQILWPSGRIDFQGLFVSLLPVSARQIGPYPDNWILGVSLPIIAIIALIRSRRSAPATPISHPEEPAAH